MVDEQGRALLIRRPENGRWEPPGGVLELGEGFAEGVRREVKEETGLDVRPEVLTGVYKNLARGVVALTFRCRILGGELTVNDEADAFRWVHPGQVRALMPEVFAYRVLDAFRDDPAPAIREHNGAALIPGASPAGDEADGPLLNHKHPLSSGSGATPGSWSNHPEACEPPSGAPMS